MLPQQQAAVVAARITVGLASVSSGKKKIPNGGETAIINWAVLKSVREENSKLLFNQNEIIIDSNKFQTNF